MIIAGLFVNELNWLCKMKTISDYYSWMVVLYFYHYRVITGQRVNLFVINNYSYIQNTE
jgi:hypothetical protein